MQNKYVIKSKNNEWCDLDYHDGTTMILIKDFITALKFDTKEEAANFLKYHSQSIKDFRIYQLKVTAQLNEWN